MATMKPLWDIFCRVVDNLGDIGVCWRLAHQLASEHPLQVRLWIDKPEALPPLLPEFDPAKPSQVIDGVTIGHWISPLPFDVPAQVVIETFACDPPPEYLAAMALQNPAPRWLNLEYLSAESWVSDYHATLSPHSRLPLTKQFFFPGFVEGTGGLLREKNLFARRDKFTTQGHANDFLASLGVRPNPDEFKISLFCYLSSPIAELMAAWQANPTPLLCLVPPGQAMQKIQEYSGTSGSWHKGNLRIEPIPFIPQSGFDQLLWSCDLNFVRGEDSFVRAQWAAKPMVWNIYPQEELAHAEKLKAFLELYGATLSTTEQHTLSQFWNTWNGLENDVETGWKNLFRILPQLNTHAETWAAQLGQQEDLASALVK